MLLALDLEKTPRLVVSSRISFPIAPVILRISSRPHAPASALCPSTQFRKGRGPGHNRRKHYAIFKELPPFRNWALGADGMAGAWGRDEIRNITGQLGADSFNASNSGAFSTSNGAQRTCSGGTGNPDCTIFDASLVVPTGPMNVPPHIWQPIILYLGRPR